MRITNLLLAAFVLALHLHALADAQIDSVAPRIRAELSELEARWIDAEVRSDINALEEILHPNFLSTFASGRTLDRASYIDFIAGMNITPFKVTNLAMVQHGDTVVVIDISESGTTKFTWIAIRRDSHWQVIAQTFTRLDPPQAEK